MAEECAALLQLSLAGEQASLGGAGEPPGDRSPYASSVSGEFAGISQGKIRLRVSGVCMLIAIVGERSMRSCLSHLLV
jgi:hypothetical protein